MGKHSLLQSVAFMDFSCINLVIISERKKANDSVFSKGKGKDIVFLSIAHNNEKDYHLYLRVVDSTSRGPSWPIFWFWSLRVQSEGMRLRTAVGQ